MSFTYKNREDSERTKTILAEQERLNNGRPAAYTPTAYTPGAAAAMSEEYLSKYLNRGPFKYDMNGDALLQQYRSNAQRQGKMAMADTMGKASAMTGGYGNSYAQTVGQQVYNDSLAEVNNVIPELWQMAYDMYEQEGNNLLAKHGVLADKEATEYARHQDEENRKYQIWSDEYSRWNAEVDRNNSNLWNSMELDRSDNADENSYAYQQDRDAVADNQWQKSFDLSKDAADSSGGSDRSLSVDDLNSIYKQAYEYGEKGDKYLENYLNGLVDHGLISGETAVNIYKQFIKSAGVNKTTQGVNKNETISMW